MDIIVLNRTHVDSILLGAEALSTPLGRELTHHHEFKLTTPNRVRSLVGTFAMSNAARSKPRTDFSVASSHHETKINAIRLARLALTTSEQAYVALAELALMPASLPVMQTRCSARSV